MIGIRVVCDLNSRHKPETLGRLDSLMSRPTPIPHHSGSDSVEWDFGHLLHELLPGDFDGHP